MVCLGNICRSPLAEGIIKTKFEHIKGEFEVDSAGTGGWHSGEQPDSRSIKVARMNGIDISGQRARQVVSDDLKRFDLIFAMDLSNYNHLLNMAAEEEKQKIHLFLEFAGMGNQDVPDPWYGELSDFESVYKLLDKSGDKVVQRIVNEYVNKQF